MGIQVGRPACLYDLRTQEDGIGRTSQQRASLGNEFVRYIYHYFLQITEKEDSEHPYKNLKTQGTKSANCAANFGGHLRESVSHKRLCISTLLSSPCFYQRVRGMPASLTVRKHPRMKC